MKKIILLFVALLSLSMDSLAQEFTEIQKKLRSDIMLFLKEEGYMPELNTNGNIQFKKKVTSISYRLIKGILLPCI